MLKISLRSQYKEERGASLVEYALLASLIAIISIIAVRNFGNKVSDKMDYVGLAVEGDYSRIAGTTSGPGASGPPPPPGP